MQDPQSTINVSSIDYSPTVGIVIINYNCAPYTLDCLRTVEKLSYTNYFVVIIDNNSPDLSGYYLQQALKDKRVTVIINPENCGFGAGNNIGIRHALEGEAEYIWLLNADTFVHPEALSQLVKQANEYPEVGAFGSKVLYEEEPLSPKKEEGKPIIWSAGASIDFSKEEVKMFGSHEEDRGQHDQLRECEYIPGCSLFFPAKVISEVGYLPEEYFMYFEETEWCTRMRKKHFKLLYVPESVVWHRFQDNKMQTPFGVYYYNRNNRYFWFRQGDIFKKIAMIVRTLFKDLPRAQRAFKKAPDEASREIFSAHRASCLDFLFGRFGKRRY